jgi:uncharacterized protein YhaN
MTLESDSLKIGRLEDKFNLYEPILISLHGVASVPGEIAKVQGDLQQLRDSSISVREQLTTLFKTQDRAYTEVEKSLEEQTRLIEKEIEDCPIADIVIKVADIKRDMETVLVLDDRVEKAEKTIESFKLKGWDLLFRIVPWIIAAGTILWAALEK